MISARSGKSLGDEEHEDLARRTGGAMKTPGFDAERWRFGVLRSVDLKSGILVLNEGAWAGLPGSPGST